MKTKKIISGLLCLCLIASSVTGCSVKTSEDLQKVSVCEVTHSVFYAPQYAAMELGYFEEEGIEIELTNGGGADNVMSAVLSGDVDIGFAGPEACIYVYNEGKDDYMQVFAQLTKKDGSFLVGREPEPDFEWTDLKDAHVLPGRVGGVPYMAFEYVLRENGMDCENDLLLDTSISYDLMGSAFVGGTGEYVTMFEPTASTMQANGEGYIVASVGESAGELPYTAYFSSLSFIDENSEMIENFVRAIYKGQQWVQSHTASEIAQVIAPKFDGTDITLLESAIQSYLDIDAYSSTPLMTEEAFNRLQTIMVQAGELDELAVYGDLINNEFAQKVTK